MSGKKEVHFSFKAKYILLFWVVFLLIDITKKSIYAADVGYILYFYIPGFVLWLLLSFPLVKIFRWSSSFRDSLRIPILILAAIAFGFIKNILTWTASYLISFTSSKPSTKTLLEAIASSTSFYYVEAIIIAGVATMLLFMWELYQKFQLKSLQTAQLETQLANANLQALKMQLQPHFLFNSHNTISMLIRTKRYDQATDMIAALSDLLRSSFKGHGTQIITLEQELELIKKYLSIEQIRFEENLKVTFDAPPDTLSQPVPSFILQPIVENAIKHGVDKHIGNTELNICARVSGSFMILTVKNTGPLLKDDFDLKLNEGVGLTNTNKRLAQLYKLDGLLQLRNEKNKVVTEIKTIIVDDEKKARDGLEALLGKNRDIELIASCKNGIEAIDVLQSNKVHLAILDIQMPGINGFEVLNSIEPSGRPVVVFATAFDQFALKAFEYHAIDYLLKPFSNERFDEMLDIAKTQILGKNYDTIERKIEALLNTVGQPSNETSIVSTGAQYNRLVIKSDGRIIFIDYDSIVWIEANDYYIKIHTGNETFLVRESLKNIETKLSSSNFARIHKSGLINTDYLKELIPSGHGEFTARLKSGRELKVSRSYKKNIASFLE